MITDPGLKTRKKAGRKGCLITLLAAIGLVLLAGFVSALTNIGLPRSQTSAQLEPLDRARLAESLNIKASLGKALWPEWTAAQNPVILWNRAYEFLVSYPGTPPLGWEAVPGETFNGLPYYRRVADNPQNFAIPVGSVWAASMANKTEADVFMIETYRSLLPPPFKQVFPYRLLIQPSETQIALVLHEDFHVFQRGAAPGRLERAEKMHTYGDQYGAASEAFKTELKQEAGLLVQALQAKTESEAKDLVRQFLQARQDRRAAAQLDRLLVDYERWLEWEEGVAKYVELKSYQLASQTPGYGSIAGLDADPYFKSYRKFNSRWSQELFQLRNLTGSIEMPFYNMGMAEAFLLDRLAPDWKGKVIQDGVFLEDLLGDAIGK